MRAVLLVLISGCSFALTQSPEPRRPCPTSEVVPVIDGVAAAALLVTSIYFVASGGEDYAQTDNASYATVAGVGAGLYAIAATKGFTNVRACRDHQIELAFEERHAKRTAPNVHAHDEAWSLTKRAAVSARNGDCKSVVGVDRALRDIDPEFHATVFARDVAIARCLVPKPLEATAPSPEPQAPSPQPEEAAPQPQAPAPATP